MVLMNIFSQADKFSLTDEALLEMMKLVQTFTDGLWAPELEFTDNMTNNGEQLDLPCLPIPQSLGEDELATFGAYREFG